MNPQIKDLENQGFIVIPNFLSDSELTQAKEDIALANQSDNKNYTLFQASDNFKSVLFKKIKTLLDKVNQQTNLTVDFIIPSAAYTDTTYINFEWHQDHESFYVHQQSYNYLNFYIPIIKPDPKKTGLSIVPMDQLSVRASDHIGKIINGGASRFTPQNNQTLVTNDDNGDSYIISINIDTIACSPILNPGDLLLMRGDVIHKTQDNDTRRVAISVRATDSTKVISRNKLLSGCKVKQQIIKNAQRHYDQHMEIFKVSDSENITAGDFYALKNELFFKSAEQ